MAESLAWYAELSPAGARRMRKEIEKAALSLPQTPIALSGRPGAIIGTREFPVGHRTPFTLVFVRDSASGDCLIYRCIYQSRNYPEE